MPSAIQYKYLISGLPIFFLFIGNVASRDTLYVNEVINPDSSEIIIPKCPAPSSLQVNFVTETSALVTWNDISAVKGQVEYQVRYKRKKGSWKTQDVYSGDGIIIEQLNSDEAFIFQIRKICYSFDGTYTTESEWIDNQEIQYRTPSNPICQELGNVEAQAGGGHNASFSIPEWYWDTIATDNCNIIFQSTWCNPGSSCYSIYWVYDGSTSFNFGPELFRLYPASQVPGNYLSEIHAFVVCPSTPGYLPLGHVYSTTEWLALSLSPSCPDTLLYSAPPNINHNCGEDFTIPTLMQGNLQSAQIGDAFTIGGFPFILTSVSGSNGVFSGAADMQLPWQGQSVNFSFSSLNVDQRKQVKSGSITIESDPIFDPNDVGAFEIGGQICIPPSPPGYWGSDGNHSVTGLPWDTNGFGQDSTYIKQPPYPGYEEGDPFDPNYDPNGFNSEGIHAVTGTLYNEYGCSQAGLNQSGNICNPSGPGPYYWLNEDPLGPETLEGIEFANEIEDTLAIMIQSILSIMEDKLNDSINLKSNDCDIIRNVMDGLITTLGYDRDFILGEDEEYFVEGMHENFKSKPQAFQVALPRDENTVELENKHISLYDCDKRLKIFINLRQLVEDFLETAGTAELKEILLEKIKRFTSQEIEQYQNVTAFMQWIEEEILEELDNKYFETYGDISYHHNNNSSPAFKYSQFPKDEIDYFVSNQVINNFKVNFHPINLPGNDKFSAITKFKNGDLWINGTHRALILDQISKNLLSEDVLSDPSLMPIRISKEISGIVYTILIDRMTFTTTGATLDAFIVIEDQRSGQKIVFQGLDINFSPNGAADSELSLASEVSIRLNNAAKLIIHGTSDTYVSWDCNGFTGMGVDASIEFCRNFLTPLDSITLNPLPETDPTRVQAHFTVEIPAWGEFVAQISVDDFAVTKAEHIRWQVEEATLDFSELTTPDDLDFPDAYTSPHVENGIASETWKGFHLSQLSATFSTQFSNDGNPMSIGVENMIIDDRGFSGEVYVQSNIISLDDGNLSGWPFSVDSLEVIFVANHLMGGAISGYINVPVFESSQDPNPAINGKDCFYYRAEMQNGGGFCFKISTGNTALKAPLFKAGELILKPNSSITISVEDTSFIAVAKLNGSLTINASISPAIGLNLDTISFSGFEISNVAPYFSPGIWSLPGSINVNVGGFSASIGDIQLLGTGEDDEAALTVKMKIGLTGDDLGICADARVQVIGKLTIDINDRQKWIYDRFSVDQVTIDADIKGNRVKGGLLFYEDDAVYNQGFRGIILLNIKALNAEILAVAQFGKHASDYKYFFVDALVNLENGIGAGSFKIIGLGGGLYYHMSRDTSESLPIPSEPTELPELGNLGEGLSNIVYIPNSSISIGFKATVVFASASENAFNGNATFEIVFNSGGGIHEISIEGNARFMAEVDFAQAPTSQEDATSPPIPASQIPLTAYVRIAYDFDNKILDGDLNVFLNTPAFKGKGPNGQMVWAKLYFAPTEWYINIGTPSNPCGIILDIPGVGQLGEVRAYLDIGTNIEDMPPFDPKVLSIAGSIRPHPMRGTGKGFAFGASVRLSTGEIKFLILRASLEVGAGFDVLIQDYGDATCFHSGNKPGINGWYASGQVWAFLEGKVGVKVAGRIIPIAELAVAAALQGYMPNPIYFRGAFGVRYRVLGGLIEGNHKFRFELGTKCEMIRPGGDSTILELEVIDDITPPYGSEEMPTDIEIMVSFNYPIGKPVEIEDGEDVDIYQINIIDEALLHEGYKIPSEFNFGDENYSRFCKPTIYLPDNDTVHFRITVEIKKNNNIIGTESDTIWFITGGSSYVILESNIEYSYPINGQYNFHPKEDDAEQGFLKLYTGQPKLFLGETKPKLLLIHSSGITTSLNYTYDIHGLSIKFDLPHELLSPGGIYKLSLIKNGIDDVGELTANVINLPGIQPAPTLPIYESLPNTQDLALVEQEVILEWVFRVSLYETFKTKIEDLIANYTAIKDKTIQITPNVSEAFGMYDIISNGLDPLITIKSDPMTILWYWKEVYQRLYKYWPGVQGNNEAYASVPFLNRSNPYLGIPPVEAITIAPPEFETRVTHDHFKAGSITTGSMSSISDWSIIETQKDWKYVQSQITSFLLETEVDTTDPPTEYQQARTYILEHDFPEYSGTKYKYLFEYTLPSGKITTTMPVTIEID